MKGCPMTTESTSSKQGRSVKKPYESPRLEVYGDIRVTDTTGYMSPRNDGGGGKTKTG